MSEHKIKEMEIAELKIAKALSEEKKYGEAWAIVDKFLEEHPDHVPAIIQGTYILDKWKKLTLAYFLARRAVDLAPNLCAAWQNYGRVCDELYLIDEAEAGYLKAVELAKRPKDYAMNLNNLASLMNCEGEWKRAEELALKTLEFEPENRKAQGNLGIAYLAQHKWAEGWDKYGCILGSEYRKFVKYADEPEWDGSPGKTVVIYGEQGIGDELSFASMVPDAIKVCKKVIIDCDERLVGLFKRSFPQAKVYGTRWAKTLDWDKEDQDFDASIAIGQLGKHFRLKDEDFPGTPYLKADPEKVLMWREYFKTKGKPVIGIAWTGGLQWTAAKFRKWRLESMKPFMDVVDAHWVSLQYKDATEEIESSGLPVTEYKLHTLSRDYDDTAALVQACDMVICMQTSVGHLAGALGKDVWVFVSRFSQWRYGMDADTVPWYKSMRLFRCGEDGVWPIKEASKVLALRYSVPRIAVCH